MLGSTVGQLKIWGPRLNRHPERSKSYVVYGEVIAGCTYFITYSGHKLLVDLQMKIEAAFFMFIILSILELFWSMSDLGVRHLIARVTEKGGKRGRTIGLLDSFGLAGQVTGFLLGGALYMDGIGFRDGLIFYVVIFFIFSCAAIIQVITEKYVNKGESSPSVDGRGVRTLLKNNLYSLFMFSLFLLVIGMNSSHQIFLYYVTDPSGLDFNEQTLSYLLIIFALSGGFMTLMGGRVSDRVGRIPVIVISGIGASTSYLLLFLVGKQFFIVIAIIYAMIGACVALTQTVAFAHVADIVPSDLQGSGFAFFNVVTAVGWGMAGFLVGGPVADILIAIGQPVTAAYLASFIVSSIIILFGTLSLLVISRTKRSDSLIVESFN
jgi:MFS family permease